MDTAQHNRIADFIWSIGDDVLRDAYGQPKQTRANIESLGRESEVLLNEIW